MADGVFSRFFGLAFKWRFLAGRMARAFRPYIMPTFLKRKAGKKNLNLAPDGLSMQTIGGFAFPEKPGKGLLGKLGFSRKVIKRGSLFCKRHGKSAFRIPKSLKREFSVFFLLLQKNKKDDFPLLFASAKSNQKQTGLRPATSVQNPCGGMLGEI